MSDQKTLQQLTQLVSYAALQQLTQVAGLSAKRLDQALQLDLARYWADELAKPSQAKPRNADPRRLVRFGFKVFVSVRCWAPVAAAS
jgi:hypothetical protein